MIRRILLYVCLFCICLTSCKPKLGETEIVIISLNDVHGSFENLAKIAAFVQETKEQHEHVIVVDAGDLFTGNPYNDFHEKRQWPIIDLLNLLGLDISVVGNHEFDYGTDVLHERLEEANFIEIAANINLKGTGLEDHIKPYHIFQKGDHNVKFFGLINVDHRTKKTTAILNHVQNVEFFCPFETTQKLRKKSRRNAHVLVAITHLGVEEDRMLADLMPELDLIIGGHSHTLIEGVEIRNGVAILQAGKHGDFVDKTTISLSNGKVTSIINKTIDVAKLKAECPIIAEKVRGYMDSPFLNTPFMTLKHDLPDETQLGNMVSDAALTLIGVDFSAMNCGSIRRDFLLAGPIAYRDILRIYPFSNHFVIMSLTASELREFIEIEWSPYRSCLMHVGGFHYVLQRDGDKAKIVELTYPNGEPLDETKLYRVAMNNYLSSRFLSDHCPTKTEPIPVYVFDNVVDFLKHNPDMDYRNSPIRARILPRSN